MLLFISLLLLISGTWAKEIVIYHTTDMHGHYFSRADKNGNDIGGFARLATVLKNTPQPYLLLDSGDFSSGSYEANLSGGKYSTDLMNMVGYTALTIGNHDSDFGDAGLSKMLADFKGDILAMNMSDLHIPNKNIKPHAIYKVDGIKVGVIGVAMDGSGSERMKIVNAPSTKDYEKQIRALKRKGAKVIIVLAHDSMLAGDNVSKDKRTNILIPIEQAKNFGDVSLMLGGHAHTQTLVGKITDEEGRGPWVLESGPYMGSVTKIVINKDDRTGEITINQPEFIILDGEEDSNVKSYLDSIRNTDLDNSIYAVVPKLITKYPAADQKDRAPAVARMMSDQMYKKIKEADPQDHVDIAAFSLNSTRSDYKPGNLTGRYFAEMAPYEEHCGTFDIGGEHLLNGILESIGYRDGNCFSVYGYSKNVHITFVCNEPTPEQPEIQPVIQSVTIDGKEVDPKKTYRMAMLTHLPRGFYEGKPFQIMPSDAIDDGTIIKHYRDITVAKMLFGVIEQLAEEQNKEVPDFVAPRDVQIEEVSSQERAIENEVKTLLNNNLQKIK